MTAAPPDLYPALGAVLAALTWEGDPKMTDFWSTSVAPYPPSAKITRVVILEETYAMTGDRIPGVRIPLRSVAPQRWTTTGEGALETLVARDLWPWAVKGDEAPLWYCERCDGRPEGTPKPECACREEGRGLEHIYPHDVATFAGRGCEGLLYLQGVVGAIAPGRRMVLRVGHGFTLNELITASFASIPRDLRTLCSAAHIPEFRDGTPDSPPWWWILVNPALRTAWPFAMALAAREVLVQEHGSSEVLVTAPPLGDRHPPPVLATQP